MVVDGGAGCNDTLVDASRAILWRAVSPSVAPSGPPNLYWATHSRCPVGQSVVAYATDDKPEFIYDAFGRDFGPLDIARTVMYCQWVDALCSAHAGCAALVHLTSDESEEDKVNSVVLCCAYLMLAEGYSAEAAFKPFASEPLYPFLDCRGEHSAGGAISDESGTEFELSTLDVLRGLERAQKLAWVDCMSFSVEDHANMLRPENGDMSWLIPGKALAFASPWCEPRDQDGLPVCTPTILSSYFLAHGVQVVVQCNDPGREEEGDRRRLLRYDGREFEEAGLRHVHIPFEDGGCPSVEIVLAFLDVVRSTSGGIAVHCRSGLGRTGTLIGILAIQNYGFSARSFIGWARLMRPGTIHGSQQQYLVNLEQHVKPGATRPLASLDEREGLSLLPRRELRFWALDCGIDAEVTRHRSHADIVELVLAAHGRCPPWRQHEGQALVSREAQSAYLSALSAGAHFRGDGKACFAQPVRKNWEVPSSLTGLNEAIASMNPAIKSDSAAVAKLESIGEVSGSGGDSSVSKADEWDEVLRYLHLLLAVQTDGNAWQGVLHRVERLRDRHSRVVSHKGDGFSEAEEQALQQVRGAREAAAAEAEIRELELSEALEQSRALQRECEALRACLAAERGERLRERKRMEGHGEALALDLQRDELRLEQAVLEVEELRGHALRQGELEHWQVDRVGRLRREIDEARESSSRDGELYAEKRCMLDSPRGEQTRACGDLTNSAYDACQSACDYRKAPSGCSFLKPGVVVSQCGGANSNSVGDHAEVTELPWDSACKSIERLRDRFQLAVKEARMTVSAN